MPGNCKHARFVHIQIYIIVDIGFVLSKDSITLPKANMHPKNHGLETGRDVAFNYRDV